MAFLSSKKYLTVLTLGRLIDKANLSLAVYLTHNMLLLPKVKFCMRINVVHIKKHVYRVSEKLLRILKCFLRIELGKIRPAGA